MILLIDNYDSFSYNVYQLIGTFYQDIEVRRNDECSLEEIEKMHPEAIILSPGPKSPKDAGICLDVIRSFYKEIPILGICLGHQAICEAIGATVTYAKRLMHGKQDKIYIDVEDPLFDGMNDFNAARYHSLSVLESTLPECLIKLAHSSDQEVMAVKHKDYPVYGLQFHPESVMTPEGYKLIENFKRIVGGYTND